MEADTGGQLAELTAAECWELLGTAEVGRVAWTTAQGPVVVPVNFAVEGSSVYVRTRIRSAMAEKVDAERVAVQVDRIDEATHEGWSVLARGRAEVRYGENAGGPQPHPWPTGPRSALVVVTVDDISGRRLEPVDH